MADSNLTQSQTIRLALLAAVSYDTAAAKEAIDFVQDDPLKNSLFIQQLNRVTTETTPVARAIKAVQEATEAYALFDISSASSTASQSTTS
ncbi:DUF2560 family protein [Rouxiella badensis]|jgi:hypothetical protein|uniref:DUF2560 family protein n=2 Tax=Rouxiella badensis TaxID=1646377 RepID=UPI001D14DA2E|nr:DUF2560 family protein [Rouxiella badensis]MCC3720539.1 DUF2560 family protein [Rouxiella badensis]MCC3730378.1 DUF2560 family protein [Rouxiella badensis]